MMTTGGSGGSDSGSGLDDANKATEAYTCDCSTAEQVVDGVENKILTGTRSRVYYECSGPRCDTCTQLSSAVQATLATSITIGVVVVSTLFF